MLKFMELVKYNTITSICKRNAITKVMDLGTGSGEDLPLYTNTNIQKLLCVDHDPQNIPIIQ